MGPLPRSPAAEANDCFMVRLPHGATEYKVAARSSRAMAGSPRIVGEQPGHCGSIAAPQGVTASTQPCGMGHTIPLRNGEQSMPTGRQPDGEHALSNARTTGPISRPPRRRATATQGPLRRPRDRRTRAQRWYDTVAGLVALQGRVCRLAYVLPDSLRDSTTLPRHSGHCRARPRRTHRYRAAARLQARLSRDKFRDAHDEIHLTLKAPYKFRPTCG